MKHGKENKKKDSLDKSDIENEELLMGQASELVDQGYGDYERIFNILKCLDGDLKLSQEYLSYLMMYENQAWIYSIMFL